MKNKLPKCTCGQTRGAEIHTMDCLVMEIVQNEKNAHTPTPIESLKEALKPESKELIPHPVTFDDPHLRQFAGALVCNQLGEYWKWPKPEEFKKATDDYVYFIHRAISQAIARAEGRS